MVHLILQFNLHISALLIKGGNMIGIYNYTVVLTYIGMLCGFAGITFAMHDNLHSAIVCLVVAGVCDMFDGKIASTMDRTIEEKKFGIQIDSLCDLISFGVLPAVILISYCSNSALSYCLGSMYVLSALIRLAWFNVDEEERQDSEDGRRKYYLGLPVTMSAAVVPLVCGIAEGLNWSGERMYPILLVSLSAAYLTPFKLKKPPLPKIGLAIFGGVGIMLLVMSGMDV